MRVTSSMAKVPANLRLISGQPYDDYELALVMKLTFSIDSSGQCVPAKDQQPLLVSPPVYEQLEPPLVSPPAWDSDLMAFKAGTDVVVQGHAYSYNGPAKSVDAELRLADVSRVLRVHGNRRVDWHGGKPRFTSAEPFEQMSLRYDRAYGGCDQTHLAKVTDLLHRELVKSYPEFGLNTATDSHYPRNPCGKGFLIKMGRESCDNMALPNLEFPFDPVTPERLAIGHPSNWMSAPLPASFDWVDPSWFPRIAYLGLTPEYTLPPNGAKEIELGWALPSLLKLPSAFQAGFHPTFQHGASSGLILRRLKPGTEVLVRNMFPKHPERTLQLSGRVPKVDITISPGTTVNTASTLNSVVLMPDQDQVIELWSARAKVTRPYATNELSEMTWKIGWN